MVEEVFLGDVGKSEGVLIGPLGCVFEPIQAVYLLEIKLITH